MSFPRYPKYKASGVEWLGEVPEGWQLNRIGYFFTERREQVSDLDFAALSVTKNGIVPQLDSAAKTDNGDNRKKVCAGDFAINSRSDRKGSAGVSGLDGSVSVITTVLSPRKSVHGPFVHHLLRSQPFQEEFYRFGKGIVADLWSTRYSEMRNIRLAVPPLPEQTAIAEFLDRETAKIDALVAEQRRLMELLKEKRQAVISHAVTKGLNPDAPMRPSGIEWLGDVPVGWEVKRLKQLTRKITDGEHISPSLSDDGIPLLSAKDVRDWLIDYDVDKFVTIENANLFWRRCQPERGDILVVSRGATVGRVGVVENEIAFCLMGSVILCKPENGFDSAFLYFALNAKHAQTSLWFSSASSAQQAIYIRDVAEISVPIPPQIERTAIANFLKTETAKFDALTAESQRAIDLLQERRTALISAAVTGQIDVRQQTRH